MDRDFCHCQIVSHKVKVGNRSKNLCLFSNESPLVRLPGAQRFFTCECLTHELCVVERQQQFSQKMPYFSEKRPNSVHERIALKTCTSRKCHIPVVSKYAVLASLIRDKTLSKKKSLKKNLKSPFVVGQKTGVFLGKNTSICQYRESSVNRLHTATLAYGGLLLRDFHWKFPCHLDYVVYGTREGTKIRQIAQNDGFWRFRAMFEKL